MSLEEDLKRVIPADKETYDMMERLRKQPPPPLEKVRAQFKASREFREKYNKEHGETGRKDGA